MSEFADNGKHIETRISEIVIKESSDLTALKASHNQIFERDRRVFKHVDRFALAKEQEKALEEDKERKKGWVDNLLSCCSRR